MFFKRKNKNEEPSRRPGLPLPRQTVFSYHANRTTPENNMGRGEIRRGDSVLTRLKNLPIILSVLVMVGAGLYALTLSATPRLVLLNNVDSLARPTAEYQEAADKLAKGSLFNRSKLTINTGAIESGMRKQFPEIDTIDVTVPLLGKRPAVTISTITPVFVLVNDKGEYYIAPDGRATAPVNAYEARPGTAVKLYDQSGLSLKPGEQILTRDTVSFITQVVLQAQAKQIKIASLTLPAAPFELQMRLDGADYYVRFNTLGDARLQSGSFLAVKDHLESQKQKPAEYIDVRVEDRAFYK
jgi:hypothetical protein